jgi:hypothetical protein
MPGEALLLGISVIAVAVAGFSGITAAMVPPGGSWHPAMRVRQRAIVSTSFNVVFESLVPSVVFAATEDLRTSMVVASAGVAVYVTGIVIWRGRQLLRAGQSLNRAGTILIALGPTAALLFWLNALVFASIAVYALALCVQLAVAAMSFYTLVSAAEG